MRSRPLVQLYLRPGVAHAGGDVTVEAVLTSRSVTPVDAIEITMRGLEHVLVPSGKSADHRVQQHVGQRASFAKRTLQEGEHRCSTKFTIPDEAPASYRGARASIEYEVEVHVRIPWWPDRRARFLMPVVRAPGAPPPPEPRVFATHPRGPQGKEPYVECSLDDVRMEVSGIVTGAVSFSNVAFARISRVDLSFVAYEIVRLAVDREEHSIEAHRFTATILDRAPREAEAIPFRVKVPNDTAPGFATGLARLEWRLAVIGFVSFGRDVKLEVPIEIRARTDAPQPTRRLAIAPPVGRERRARVWSDAARELGLESDAEREEMRTTYGAALTIVRLEHREGVGMHVVADLSWPALATSIELRERRWTDAFAGDELSIADAKFTKRFHLRGDRELAELIFEQAVCAAVIPCSEVQLDEEGAQLARPTSVQSSASLAADVAPLLVAARAIGEAVARAPTRVVSPYR